MKVHDFVKNFTIDPSVHIEPNFKETKKLEADITKMKSCFNCGDTANKEILKSVPWTIVQYCWKCNHLNVLYVQDKMEGFSLDTVICYTNKP